MQFFHLVIFYLLKLTSCDRNREHFYKYFFIRRNCYENTLYQIDKMSFNKTNSSLWPCFHLIHVISTSWNLECLLCRAGGIVISFISVICFILNTRYLIWYQQERCRNTLVLSLFIASFLVLTISVPGILLQLFTCHRYCNKIYCRIEGFISYLCGCLCMLIYTILSISRYLVLCQYNKPSFCRYSTIICWIFSICWTLVPVFDYWIPYVPEGLGFHCSINWKDHSRINELYILFSFLGIYLIPLFILFLINFRVNEIIQNIYLTQSSFYSYPQTFDQKNQRRYFNYQSNNTICYIRKAADRKRFRIQHRFVRAMIFLVSAYIFAWTPYSIIAILQLFHIQFISEYSFCITLSTLIAKLAVISAALVYLRTMHCRLFKKILF
jgi:hypothetical protein